VIQNNTIFIEYQFIDLKPIIVRTNCWVLVAVAELASISAGPDLREQWME